MKKYLRCFSIDGRCDLTVGKRYEIVDIDDCLGNKCYVIIDDAGDRSHWPIETDHEGESYRDWFTLEIDEEPRKIDGRKAEITHPGKQYSTYRRFAIKHGYPNAAAESDEDDPRRTPQPGDIVTLLVSGKHEREGEGMLWIVEAAKGERHIFNEKGLRILSDVTVLKDEELGGIEREYREIKRKANVGERIKIVGERIGYKIGSVFTVEDDDYPWGKVFRDGTGVAIDGGNPLFHKNYVVLEPTDIVRIDGERLRMVDRKAAVGEHVIVTEQVNDDRFSIGETYRVVYVYGGSTWVEHPEGAHVESGGAFLPKYRVLEPVSREAESAKTAAPTAPLSAQPPALLSERSSHDQAAANISALQAQVKALESRVAALENKVAAGPVDDTPPSFAGMPRAKSLQQIRDEIVERAKADIEGVKKPWNISAHPQPLVYTYKHYVVDVEFIVNRDKRTVVAIARWRYNGKIVSRGIAKCAPGDVFNAHIGRAIALRRALGLEIPAEYLNVPNPEEPRVGDVVIGGEYGYLPGVSGVVKVITGDTHGGLYYQPSNRSRIYDYAKFVNIIDDSRESVEEVAA